MKQKLIVITNNMNYVSYGDIVIGEEQDYAWYVCLADNPQFINFFEQHTSYKLPKENLRPISALDRIRERLGQPMLPPLKRAIVEINLGTVYENIIAELDPVSQQYAVDGRTPENKSFFSDCKIKSSAIMVPSINVKVIKYL